jgi:hypothetical protein
MILQKMEARKKKYVTNTCRLDPVQTEGEVGGNAEVISSQIHPHPHPPPSRGKEFSY